MTERSVYLRRIAARTAVGAAAPAPTAFGSGRFWAEPREPLADPFEAPEPMLPTTDSPVSAPRVREPLAPSVTGEVPVAAFQRDASAPFVPKVQSSFPPELQVRSAPERPELAPNRVVREVAREPSPPVEPHIVEQRVLVEERRALTPEPASLAVPRDPLVPVPERHTLEPTAVPPVFAVESAAPSRLEREPTDAPPRDDIPEEASSGQLAAALARMDRLLRPDRHVAPSEPAAVAPADGPRVNIGRVRVEVIAERPTKKAPAANGPRALGRSASLGGIPSKLRFGLGQV